MAVNLTDVLEKYDLNIYGIKKTRGAYAVDTDRGLRLLCECNKGDSVVDMLHSLQQCLAEQGFGNVDFIVKNAEGNLVTEDEEHRRYILKEWFDAKECDITDEEQVLSCVRQLAKLHNVFGTVRERKRYTGRLYDMAGEYDRHTRELRKTSGYIRNKRVKNEFELLAGNNIGKFVEDASLASRMLCENDYEERLKAAKENMELCHGDYNYHNVLFNNDFVAVTDFENVGCGMQIGDLYTFMRKILEKCDWDIEFGRRMLYEYINIKPITCRDMNILAAFFIYPEKLWKVINVYFNRKKSLVLQKNMDKLKVCIRQRELKNLFVQELLQTKV